MRQPLAIRAHPLVFGVIVFLASESMFFAALFAAYFDLRSTTAIWPPSGTHLDIGPATVGTGLLALSSLTMIGFQFAVARNRLALGRGFLFTTIVLGAVFLAITLNGWRSAGFGIDSSAYGSLFYTMTGFHALHVTAGLIAIAYLTIFTTAPAFTTERRAGSEAIAYYWHFVFVVWLGLWATIYLVR
jgi:cytochrome c oxidase subunit 3